MDNQRRQAWDNSWAGSLETITIDPELASYCYRIRTRTPPPPLGLPAPPRSIGRRRRTGDSWEGTELGYAQRSTSGRQ